MSVGHAASSGSDAQLLPGDTPIGKIDLTAQLIHGVTPIVSIDLTLADANKPAGGNQLTPIFSVPLVLQHGSAEHTHLFMSAKSNAAFQCHKCKLTVWGERFRCTRDVMTVVCPYVLCPGCHKAHKALAKSAQGIKPATSTAKSSKERKVAAATTLTPSNGVVKTAMIPIMSAVIPAPTTPASVNGAGASKRKVLSPSVNGPPVAGDKILKTLESVAKALDESSKLSQNPPLTQISGQKNKQQ